MSEGRRRQDPQHPQERQVKCDVFSRVVGFLTPVSHWNVGKQQEWRERVTYKVKGKGDDN